MTKDAERPTVEQVRDKLIGHLRNHGPVLARDIHYLAVLPPHKDVTWQQENDMMGDALNALLDDGTIVRGEVNGQKAFQLATDK
jgi:hypothetical protein